jgi:hypothetical protein
LLHGDAVGLENAVIAARAIRWAARATWAKSSGLISRMLRAGGLRDHQRMAGTARHDVEKGEDVVVLITL